MLKFEGKICSRILFSYLYFVFHLYHNDQLNKLRIGTVYFQIFFSLGFSPTSLFLSGFKTREFICSFPFKNIIMTEEIMNFIFQ